MIIVEGSILIDASPDALFALSQDYNLRREWDPFVRDMRFLGRNTEAGLGVEVWVRAWTGLTMTVRFTSFRPPVSVAMKMVRGPWFFRRFAGTWLFKVAAAGRTDVTFRYCLETRWPWLKIFHPIIAWIFRRDVRGRLRGLKHGAENGGLLERLGETLRLIPFRPLSLLVVVLRPFRCIIPTIPIKASRLAA
jgi:ribosome-associated toxin RatA of RatAB toxin-antitoxin module